MMMLHKVMDARSPGYHRVQVWSQSSHSSRSIRSDLRKMFTDRHADRQTDRRTDNRQTTDSARLYLAHGMS